jgi:hypothetical protein
MVLIVQIVLLRVVTLCNLLGRHQCFGGIWSFIIRVECVGWGICRFLGHCFFQEEKWNCEKGSLFNGWFLTFHFPSLGSEEGYLFWIFWVQKACHSQVPVFPSENSIMSMEMAILSHTSFFHLWQKKWVCSWKGPFSYPPSQWPGSGFISLLTILIDHILVTEAEHSSNFVYKTVRAHIIEDHNLNKDGVSIVKRDAAQFAFWA